MDDHTPSLAIDSIDVFITDRCGLRCSHCFVGEDLNSNLDFDFALFDKLLGTAKTWGTKEITFLGGEPTLYPRIIEAIELAQHYEYRTRVVTNGHLSYSRFIDRCSFDVLPFICFSIDGSSEDTHDVIRGKGSFNILMDNILRSKSLGYKVAGITAISRENLNDIAEILFLCDSLELEWLNIHYVTNRGFARLGSVPSINEWKETLKIIRQSSSKIRTKLRVENTFIFEQNRGPIRCAVRDKSNLMFLPDGRVYMCMMFIDVPNSHSFLWTQSGLQANHSNSSEQRLVMRQSDEGCPAMSYVNPSVVEGALENNALIQCIYQKEELASSS